MGIPNHIAEMIKNLSAKTVSVDEAMTLGLEVATLISTAHSGIEETKKYPTEWGLPYETALKAGVALVNAEIATSRPLASAGLSVFCPELQNQYLNIPVGAWIAQLLLKGAAVFDHTSWIAQHAYQFMSDPWGLHLLKKNNLPGTRDVRFDWLRIYPREGLDYIKPDWDDSSVSDYMVPEDYVHLIWKLRRDKKLPPHLRALILVFKNLAGAEDTPLRSSFLPKQDWLIGFLPDQNGKLPRNFESIFTVPSRLDDDLSNEVRDWLHTLSLEEFRTLYFIGMSESAYIYRIQEAFCNAHPKEKLAPLDMWSR